MYDFTYHRPASLAEARAAFDALDDAAYLSGGHTLLPAMKSRLADPSDLISLAGLSELKGIAREGDRLVIGAAETHADVAASPLVRETIPALAGLAGSIGDVQVRHRGTMGGSVANNDPAADYPSAVLALDAEIVTTDRTIAADAFFEGMYTTALEPGEILTSIAFRIPQSAGYAKMRNPASRYAMAATFVARHADGVRAAITGAGNDGVFRWSAAEDALNAAFEADALSGLTLDPADMNTDMHASASYRAHLCLLCTQRAVAGQGALTLL
ncbi:MAG: xanthine dehydrogenase family protein subunit M [Paracoccaceae bacterium]